MAKEKYTINGSTYDGNKIRARVIAYNNSDKGKKTREQWLEKNKDRIKAWLRTYSQRKRLWAKQNGYCTTCFKRKTEGGFKTCQFCISKQRRKKNESQIK